MLTSLSDRGEAITSKENSFVMIPFLQVNQSRRPHDSRKLRPSNRFGKRFWELHTSLAFQIVLLGSDESMRRSLHFIPTPTKFSPREFNICHHGVPEEEEEEEEEAVFIRDSITSKDPPNKGEDRWLLAHRFSLTFSTP